MAGKTLVSNLKISNLNNFLCFRHFSAGSHAMGKHYDIIIAGGGMVGTAMACALGENLYIFVCVGL